MKTLFKRYRFECITAGACGAVCLVFLAPLISDTWGDWQRERRNSRGGNVIVYQTLTGHALMRGNSVRDAVEKRLQRYRAAYTEAGGRESDLLMWSGLSSRMLSFPPDQVDRLVSLSQSFYGADLRGADLAGVDFRGINLQHADFEGANLAGARLDGASLGGATFARADLSRVQFGARPENIPDYRWPAAGNAPGALFHGCDLEGETLSGRFTGASFQSANLRGATFRLWQSHDLDFSGADLTDACFEILPAVEPVPWLAEKPSHFYETVRYDENTKVKGLRLIGVSDPDAPFVQWAVAQGARLDAPAEAEEAPPALAASPGTL